MPKEHRLMLIVGISKKTYMKFGNKIYQIQVKIALIWITVFYLIGTVGGGRCHLIRGAPTQFSKFTKATEAIACPLRFGLKNALRQLRPSGHSLPLFGFGASKFVTFPPFHPPPKKGGLPLSR